MSITDWQLLVSIEFGFVQFHQHQIRSNIFILVVFFLHNVLCRKIVNLAHTAQRQVLNRSSVRTTKSTRQPTHKPKTNNIYIYSDESLWVGFWAITQTTCQTIARMIAWAIIQEWNGANFFLLFLKNFLFPTTQN